MAHTFSVQLTDEEFDLVCAALIVRNESTASRRAVQRELRSILHAYIADVFGTDDDVLEMVELATHYRRRIAVGLRIVEGGS